MVRGLIALNLFLALLLAPVLVFAQTPSSPDIQAVIRELQEQIKLLQSQVVELKSKLESTEKEAVTAKQELQVTQEEVKAIREELKLTRALKKGEQGDDVKTLQEFLKQFPDIYPEGLVTGFFGELTERAVKKFQEKHGIVTTGTADTTGYGQIGPKTIAKVNELLTEGAGASGVIPFGLSHAPGIQKKLEPISTTIVTTSVPSGVTPAIPAQPVGLTGTTTAPAVPAVPVVVSTSTPIATSTVTPIATSTATTTTSTATGTSQTTTTTSGTSGSSGGVTQTTTTASSGTTQTTTTTSTTSSDVTPPIISRLTAEGIKSTSVFINWETNELASVTLYYSTTSPFLLTSALSMSRGLVFSGSFEPSSLTPNTTYYFILAARDSSGNFATSTERSFTTIATTATTTTATTLSVALSDTTPPTISNLQASSITSSSAAISWSLNKTTNGVIYYAQSSPVMSGTGLTAVFAGDNAQSYSKDLTGLSAGTTYYYLVTSKDTSSNTATSSENSFSTPSANKPELLLRPLNSTYVSGASGGVFPNNYTVNTPVKISFSIKNTNEYCSGCVLGPVNNTIPNFVIEDSWYSSNITNGTAAGVTLQNVVNNCPSDLQPFSSCTASFDLTFSTTGTKSIFVAVDRQNTISEYNDNNNAGSITFGIYSTSTTTLRTAPLNQNLASVLKSLLSVLQKLQEALR